MPTFEPLEGDVVLRDRATTTLESVAERADAAAESMTTFAAKVSDAVGALTGLRDAAQKTDQTVAGIERLVTAMSGIDPHAISEFDIAASSLADTMRLIATYSQEASGAVQGVTDAITNASRQAQEAEVRFAAMQAKFTEMATAEAATQASADSAGTAAESEARLGQIADEAERLQEALDETDPSKLTSGAQQIEEVAGDMKKVATETDKATESAEKLAGAIEKVGEAQETGAGPNNFQRKLDDLNRQFEEANQQVTRSEQRIAQALDPGAQSADPFTQPAGATLPKQGGQGNQVLANVAQGALTAIDPTGGMLAGPAAQLIAGNAGALSKVAIAGGAAGLAVGGVVVAFQKVAEAMEQADRKARLIDNLKDKFKDVGATVESVQKSIGGVASEEQITGALSAIDGTSVLTDVENLTAITEIAKENAYELGVSWQDAMGMITQAIQSGDFSALEKAGLIKSGEQALLDYAASVDKLVPQLNQFEREQAIVNALIDDYAESAGATTSPSENLANAYASLNSALADVQGSFFDWVVALIDPEARNAIEWWAGVVNSFASGVSTASEIMDQATTDRRIANSQSISDADKDLYQNLQAQQSKFENDFQDQAQERFGIRVNPNEEGLNILRGYAADKEPGADVDAWIAQNDAVREAAEGYAVYARRVEEARRLLSQGESIEKNPAFAGPALQQQIAESERLIADYNDTLSSLGAADGAPAPDSAVAETITQTSTLLEQEEAKLRALKDRYDDLDPASFLFPEEKQAQAEQDAARIVAEQQRQSEELATAIAKSSEAYNTAGLPAVTAYKAGLAELNELQSQHTALLEESERAENEYGVAIAQAATVAKNAADAQANQPALERNIQQWKLGVDALEEQLADLEQRISNTTVAVANTDNPVLRESLSDDLAGMVEERVTLEAALTQGVTELADMQRQLDEAKAAILANENAPAAVAALRKEADDAKDALAELDAQIAASEEGLASLQKKQPGIDLGQAVTIDRDAELERLRELQRAKAALDAASSAPSASDGGTDPSTVADGLKGLADNLGGVNAQIEALDGANVSQVLEALTKASDAARAAELDYQAALASGDAARVESAERTKEVADAQYDYALAAADVARTSLEEQEAISTGNQSKIEAAAASRTAAESRLAEAEANKAAQASLLDEREAYDAVIAASEELARARAIGNASLIASAEANLEYANTHYLAITATDSLKTSMVGLINIAGIMVDATLGLPVAFDASALSAEQADVMIRQLTLSLQQLEAQAINSAVAMSSRLVPFLGIAGSYEKGLEFADQQSKVSKKFNDINQQRIDAGQSPLDQGIYVAARDALSANQSAQVSDMEAEFRGVGDAAGGAADAMERATKRMNAAIEGMVRSVSKDTTQGLIPLDELLPREDEVDENARRMADVAVKGFQSPWFEGLKGMFPEDVLAEGEDAVKHAAAQMVKDHQDGLTTMFYDVDRAAEQVLKKIKGQSEMDQYVENVRQKVLEMGGEEGLTDEDIADMLGLNDDLESQASAAGRQMATAFTKSFEEIMAELDTLINGGGPPGTTEGEAKAGEEGEEAAQEKFNIFIPVLGNMEPPPEAVKSVEDKGVSIVDTVAEAMVAHAVQSNPGGRAMASIVGSLDAAQADVQGSGKRVAGWFGEEFKKTLETDIPAGLLAILVSELVPLLASAAAANDSGEGGGGSV